MGWTFGININKGTKTELDNWCRRNFREHIVLIDSDVRSFDSNSKGWFAIYYDTKEKQYDILLTLFEKWDGEWGYKDIGRPIMYGNTPERLMLKIAKLNPALAKDDNWRDWCKNYWSLKAEQKLKKAGLTEGATIKFKSVKYGKEKRDTFKVRKFGRRIIFETPDTHELWNLRKWRSQEYEIVKEAA